jgi:hypothetical protein
VPKIAENARKNTRKSSEFYPLSLKVKKCRKEEK